MISPYTFILCQNILSLILHRAHDEVAIKGVKVCEHSSLNNHLLFADYSSRPVLYHAGN